MLSTEGGNIFVKVNVHYILQVVTASLCFLCFALAPNFLLNAKTRPRLSYTAYLTMQKLVKLLFKLFFWHSLVANLELVMSG